VTDDDSLTLCARHAFAVTLREGWTIPRSSAEHLARYFAWRHWVVLERRRLWTTADDRSVGLAADARTS
jgi:hypothetical protein